MNKMIVANLMHRPIRSIISVLAIGLEVTLILMIVGLSLGMLNDNKTRQAGIGFDLMVQPPGATVFGGMSGAPLSIKIGDKLRALDGVAAVAPVVTQVASGTSVEVLYGIDLASWQNLSGPFRYIEGGPFQGPDDAIVDDIYAESKHARIGDPIEALGHKFRISGIIEHGAGGRKLFPMQTIQDIIGAPDKASIFYIKLKNPNDTERVSQEIKAIPGMQDYTVRSLKEWLSQMTPDHLPGFSIFLRVVVGVSMVIGFMVIFQSMYTAVIERTREIGILKSLGASKLYIVNVILRETSLLAVGGIVVGTAISSIAERILLHAFPTLRMMWDWHWVMNAAILALVGALIGAFYPALKAAQKDPIDALAYD